MITFEGKATCTQCRCSVAITINVVSGHTWNGIIGPGSSGSKYHNVHPNLPDGWIDSEFYGHFCSENCEDDYNEKQRGYRPNEARRKDEAEQAAKEEEARARLQKAITPEERAVILRDLLSVQMTATRKRRRR